MPLAVLVADPDDRAAVAFGTALRGTEFSFAGAVSNGKALLDALFTQSPWAVALDMSLPDHPAAPNVGWATTVPQLREIAPAVRTMVTFRPELGGLVHGALRSGTRAFAEKPYLRDEIVAALRHLATDNPAQKYFARARRVPRPLALRYRLASGPGTAVVRVGIARNISETGLLVGVAEKLVLRTVLHIDLELPDRTSLKGRAQVVRDASVAGAPTHEYGISLFDMDPASREGLRAFIRLVLAGDPNAGSDSRRFAPAAAAPPTVKAAR